ncbi:MAG TPA: SAM-dependent methyltransferase [Trebonia sp.]
MFEDSGQVRQMVRGLLDAVPSGSSHAGIDLLPEEIGAFEEVLNQHLPGDHHVARTRDMVTGFFDAVRLLEPGAVRVSDWRPGSPDEAATPATLRGGADLKP